jgi:hypothetical protein
MTAGRNGGDRYSEAVRRYFPEVAGRADEVTAARARNLAEKPAVTAEDVLQFRAALAAEQARRRAAADQLNRDVLALLAETRGYRR